MNQEELYLRQAGFDVPLTYDEEGQQQQEPQISPQEGQPVTPRQVATERDEEGNYVTQEAELNDGFFTKAGNVLESVVSGDWVNDALSTIAPDTFKTNEELDQARQQRFEQVKEEGNLLEKGLVYTSAGLEVTASALPDLTVQLPATVGARLTNQNAPWLNPPAIVKDDPLGQTAYEIVQVVAPSVVLGVATGGSSLAVSGKVLLAESALETIPQRSADDLVLGREQAIKLGEMANALGYDGAQLTRDLIEGRTPQAQSLNAVLGYIQNLGFNVGANKLLGFFGSKAAGVEDVARVTGQSEDAVTKSLDNVATSKGTPLQEPMEMVDLDSAVSAKLPSKGNEYVSREGLTAELLRGRGLDEDFLTAADRNYFSNIKAVADEEGVQRVVKEATKTVRRLKEFPEDLAGAMGRADNWWSSNKHLIDEGNYDALARNFLDGDVTIKTPEGIEGGMVDNVNLTGAARNFDFDLDNPKVVENMLREFAVVGEEGFISAAIVGEELGVRVQRMARQVMNQFDAGIDVTKSIDDIVDLHDTAQLFLIPLRRGKRRWAVDGILQQRKNIRKIKDADVRGAIRQKDPVSATASSRSFETISVDGTDPGKTLRELWDSWKTGNQESGETLKAYLGLISYGDPLQTMSQVDNLTKVLEKQLRGSLPDAQKSLYYSYLVSRVRPQQASLSSNMFNLLRGPIGEAIQGNRARAMGQFLGGASVWNEAWGNAVRAFKKGSSVIDMTGASKIDMDAVALAAKNQSLDNLYEGVRKELNQRGANQFEKFTARMAYLQQRLANAPGQKLYARLLTAQDDFAKTLHGGQIATGRAWVRHADEGGDLKAIVKEEFDKVFHNGVANGKIIDDDVLMSARNLTFQSPIPRTAGEYANQADMAFAALQDAAQESKFWNFTSPFTKLSYNVLEQTGRQLAGNLNATMAPINAVSRAMGKGSVFEPGTYMLTRLSRYDAIMKGELGELARQQLKSDMAFGEGWTVSVATLAAMGGATGNNPPPGYPRQSFIIPAPWTEKGWVAISYERLDPISAPTAITIDLVQSFQRGDITNRFFEKGMNDLISSVLISTVDKSFTTGLRETAAMFDVRNLSENSLARTATSLATAPISGVSGAYGGLTRMVADWINPYATLSKDQQNGATTFWRSLSQRVAGGLGNPILYDPLSGKPMMKNGLIDSDNLFVQMLGAPLAEAFVPGRTQRGEHSKVYDMMSVLDYEWNPRKLVSSVDGLSLNPEQQSKFSEQLHSYGNLNQVLLKFTEDNRADLNHIKRLLERGENQKAADLQNVLQSRLTRTIQAVKTDVANNAPIAKELGEQRLIHQSGNMVGSPYREQPSGLAGQAQRFLQQVHYK